MTLILLFPYFLQMILGLGIAVISSISGDKFFNQPLQGLLA